MVPTTCLHQAISAILLSALVFHEFHVPVSASDACISRQLDLDLIASVDGDEDRAARLIFQQERDWLSDSVFSKLKWKSEPSIKHPMRTELDDGRIAWVRVDGVGSQARVIEWLDQGWSESLSMHLNSLLALGMVHPVTYRRVSLDPRHANAMPGTQIQTVHNGQKNWRSTVHFRESSAAAKSDTKCGRDSHCGFEAFLRAKGNRYIAKNDADGEYVDIAVLPTIRGVGKGKHDVACHVDGLSMGGVSRPGKWQARWARVLSHKDAWSSLPPDEGVELLDFVDVALIDHLTNNQDRYRGKNWGYATDGRLYAFDNGLGWWQKPDGVCLRTLRAHPYIWVPSSVSDINQFVLQGMKPVHFCSEETDEVRQCRFRKHTIDRLKAVQGKPGGLGAALWALTEELETVTPLFPARHGSKEDFVRGMNERADQVLALVGECEEKFGGGGQGDVLVHSPRPYNSLVFDGPSDVNAGAPFSVEIAISPHADAEGSFSLLAGGGEGKTLALKVAVFDEQAGSEKSLAPPKEAISLESRGAVTLGPLVFEEAGHKSIVVTAADPGAVGPWHGVFCVTVH